MRDESVHASPTHAGPADCFRPGLLAEDGGRQEEMGIEAQEVGRGEPGMVRHAIGIALTGKYEEGDTELPG